MMQNDTRERKDRILIIGAGEFQLPLVREASGTCDVYLAAPAVPDIFKPYIADTCIADVRDRDTILDYARRMQIDGVATDQTDIAVRTVAYVAEQMGLPGIGYKTSCLFTDKALMRKRLNELGIPVLPNRTVHTLEEALVAYDAAGPLVIMKPVDMQGSRGVFRCASKEDIKERYERSLRWSGTGEVIVEKYAGGPEFVCEGVAYDGSFRNLILLDSYNFGLPDVYAAHYRITPSTASEETVKRILELNLAIHKGFGLKQGITHAEYIMDGDDIYLLETAARGGGVYISSDLIRYAGGFDASAFLVDLALGRAEAGERFRAYAKMQDEGMCPGVTCGYMACYIPEGEVTAVRGADEVAALPYVHHHQLSHLKEGVRIMSPAEDKTSRIAVIVEAPSRAVFYDRCSLIRDMLKVEVRNKDEVRGLIWD